jgi:hypothetical protein
MPRFKIEVTHENTWLECVRAIHIFVTSGSHFLVNADWGCIDGEHKAWFFMDADNKDQAMMIVPPGLRKDTKITQVTKFSQNYMEELRHAH